MHFISLLESGAIFPRSGQDVVDSDQGQTCECCKNIIEDECFGAMDLKWHPSCLKCLDCNQIITENEAFYELNSKLISCEKHHSTESFRMRKVSRLEQYSSLLVFALKRLCKLLNVEYPRNSFLLI